MKSLLKSLCLVFAISLLFSLFFSTFTFAAGADRGLIGNVTGGGHTTGIEPTIQDVGGSAYKIVQMVGNILAVLILLIFGIKWMLATPQKKAELKDKAWNYVIGAGLLFGGVNIVYILSDFWTTVIK